MRKRTLFLLLGLWVAGLLLVAGIPSSWAQQQNFPQVKEFRIERSMPLQAVACIECHKAT